MTGRAVSSVWGEEVSLKAVLAVPACARQPSRDGTSRMMREYHVREIPWHTRIARLVGEIPLLRMERLCPKIAPESAFDPMQEEMREWRHAARLSVNGSLPRLYVNARLVNRNAGGIISGLFILKKSFSQCEGGSAAPSM